MKKQTFAVECVSVKHWIIVVGPASGGGITADPGSEPGRATEPRADAGKKVLPAVVSVQGRRHRLAGAEYAGRAEKNTSATTRRKSRRSRLKASVQG